MRGFLAVFLTAAAVVTGQTAGGVAERFEKSPLSPDQRQAITDALAKRDYPRVESAFRAAIGKDAPPSRAAELEALLGALEFVSGRMDQAIAAFRRSDVLVPLSEQDRFTFAMALVQERKVGDSRAQLSLLNQRHPNQTLYLYWLARLDYDERLYDAAVEKLRRVVQLDPKSVRGYDNLGLCFDMMGMPDEAVEAFTKAVTLNRQQATPSPWPPHNFGALLLRLQRFHEAEENLRESLKYDPGFAMAHYHLGRVLENEAAADGAIAEYKKAAELDQKFAEPLYSLGLLYRRKGRAAEAGAAMAEYKKRKALAP